MQSRWIWLVAAVLVLASGCAGAIKKKSFAEDEYWLTTRTYWYGIPIYEERHINEGIVPSDTTDRMRQMGTQLHNTDNLTISPSLTDIR